MKTLTTTYKNLPHNFTAHLRTLMGCAILYTGALVLMSKAFTTML